MTICDVQYHMPAIFTLNLSTIWAITVAIAITDYELYNSIDNSATLPSVQAVHPTVFPLPRFSNRLNGAITQLHPPQKNRHLYDWLWIKLTVEMIWRPSYSVWVREGF